MAVMKRKNGKSSPGISSGSLPDIVFMLLFFFMVSTSMREVEMKVRTELPTATEISKLEKKTLVSFIYVGPPTKALAAKWGDRPRIQLNTDYCNLEQILTYVASERDKLKENERPLMTVSIKADKNVKMGIITDIKQELRKANALKICYVSQKTMGY